MLPSKGPSSSQCQSKLWDVPSTAESKQQFHLSWQSFPNDVGSSPDFRPPMAIPQTTFWSRRHHFPKVSPHPNPTFATPHTFKNDYKAITNWKPTKIDFSFQSGQFKLSQIITCRVAIPLKLSLQTFHSSGGKRCEGSTSCSEVHREGCPVAFLFASRIQCLVNMHPKNTVK